MNIKEASEMESEVFGSLFGTPEALEGMRAFLEKRPAKFN
jgi:enoyl-CoA hydratase